MMACHAMQVSRQQPSILDDRLSWQATLPSAHQFLEETFTDKK